MSRNIRPRIACICPFHHDWDAERVAYRNAVKIEIARKKLEFKPNPTYESLLRCLTRESFLWGLYPPDSLLLFYFYIHSLFRGPLAYLLNTNYRMMAPERLSTECLYANRLLHMKQSIRYENLHCYRTWHDSSILLLHVGLLWLWGKKFFRREGSIK